MLNRLYENIGGKIKSLAKWIFIVDTIASIITGVLLLEDGWGLLILILGPIAAWVSSWILYAFGELVEDVHQLKCHNLRTHQEDILKKASKNITHTEGKRCPNCGEIVNSNRCEMCGEEINY